MRSYITKPTSIKKSEIEKGEFSFSVSGFYQVPKTEKSLLLRDALETFLKGEDMEEGDFLSFKTEAKYLKTASLTGSNFLADIDTSNSFEYIAPALNHKFVKNIRNINKYDILYTSTGSNSSIGECALMPNGGMYNFSSHIFKLKPKDSVDRFYLFALLKSQYGKDSCDLEVPKAGIMRRGGTRFLNVKIPFPTFKNNKKPEEVEKLVSLLVQNIIDKEEQIKLKNAQIDEQIEKELKENQKSSTNFKYSYPRISEIKSETRLDTGLYTKSFKKNDFLIKNYSNGILSFDDLKLNVSRGQNLQITTIGESYYSEIKKNGFYKLILSKYFGYRTIEKITFLGNKKELKQIEEGDIIFSCRGDMGKTYFFPEDIKDTITNIDNIHIKGELEIYIKTFIFLFLGYLKTISVIDNIACTGSGAPSFTQYHFSKLYIPNFPEEKQKEIAKLYYNKLPKNEGLGLENYLEREKVRNSELGIFQLNMEIFTLREYLEEVIHKIIMEEAIEISSYL